MTERFEGGDFADFPSDVPESDAQELSGSATDADDELLVREPGEDAEADYDDDDWGDEDDDEAWEASGPTRTMTVSSSGGRVIVGADLVTIVTNADGEQEATVEGGTIYDDFQGTITTHPDGTFTVQRDEPQGE